MATGAKRVAVRVCVGRSVGRGSWGGAAVLASAVVGVVGLGTPAARAELATYTWDVNGASPTNPQDGATPVAGPWVATDVKWSDGTQDVAWPNTGNEVAVFGNDNGAAGTVYPAFAAQFAGITFNKPGSGAYNIGGFTDGSVTLTGNNPVVTVNASGATISSIINGTGGFVKEGSGALVISQTQNTFSGPITINAGTLNVVEGNGLQVTGALAGATRVDLVNAGITGATGAPTFQLSNGGILSTGLPINVTFSGTDPAGDYRAQILTGALVNKSGSPASQPHTVSGAITVGGSAPGSLTLGGGVSSGNLTVTGPVTLSSAARQNLLIAPTSSRVVVSGSIDATGLTQGGQIVFGSAGPITWSGGITAGSNVDVVMNRTTTTTGIALSSPSATNTWGNTYFQAGVAVLGTSNGLPATTILTMGKDGAAGTATYQMNGQSQTVAGLASAPAATGGVLKVTNSSATTLGGTLTINTAAGTSYSYGTAAGSATATIEGSLNVTKSGPGTQTFTGANTYTGLTTVTGGSLVLTKDAFTPATLTGAGGADVTGGRLLFDYSGGGANPVAEVAAALKASHDASPAWSSGQIRSSAADAVHGLGYYDDGTAVKVAYTYVGDLNLDERVNADDYALLDRGFAAHLTGWVNGDVNYDGAVNEDDYMAVDTAYVTAGVAHDVSGLLAAREARFGEAYVGRLVAAVPEPAGLGTAAVLLAGVGGRRRRRGA